MLQSSLAELLSKISESKPLPRMNIGLSDGNRLTVIDWDLKGDCLVEHWPNESPRHLVPLAQIVAVEIPDGD